ncbi:MAG: hypothetical protein RI947_1229 [Candidatus Parcubacteria bacterium]|jgi:hypothetical protein
MSTLGNTGFLVTALDEQAAAVGLTTERLVFAVLKVTEETYQQIISGRLTVMPEVLDALMRFYLILGVREANPKFLIDASDSDMATWNEDHYDEVITLCNDLDVRWRKHLQFTHEMSKKTVLGGLVVTLVSIVLAVAMYFVTSAMHNINTAFGVIMFLSLFVALISAYITADTWREQKERKRRYRTMKLG